jgi:hypothetical protein
MFLLGKRLSGLKCPPVTGLTKKQICKGTSIEKEILPRSLLVRRKLNHKKFVCVDSTREHTEGQDTDHDADWAEGREVPDLFTEYDKWTATFTEGKNGQADETNERLFTTSNYLWKCPKPTRLSFCPAAPQHISYLF